MPSSYEAIQMSREVLAGKKQLHGDKDPRTISSTNNLASSLAEAGQFDEALSTVRKLLPFARRVLGADHDETLNIEMNIGIFPYKKPTASREDVLEAITVLDALGKRLVRILGIKHPKTFNVQAAAYQARQKLAAKEPPRRATLEDALAAFDL